MRDVLLPVTVGCAVAVLSAISVVFARKQVHAAASLLVHSLALAALYLMLAAEMVAMGQVIIYAGAIVVLFLFVVLLLPQGGNEVAPGTGRVALAMLIGASIFAPIIVMLASLRALTPTQAAPDGSAASIGRALFGSQLVPFELTTGLLLVAIIGAVALWRRQSDRPTAGEHAPSPHATEQQAGGDA